MKTRKNSDFDPFSMAERDVARSAKRNASSNKKHDAILADIEKLQARIQELAKTEAKTNFEVRDASASLKLDTAKLFGLFAKQLLADQANATLIRTFAEAADKAAHSNGAEAIARAAGAERFSAEVLNVMFGLKLPTTTAQSDRTLAPVTTSVEAAHPSTKQSAAADEGSSGDDATGAIPDDTEAAVRAAEAIAGDEEPPLDDDGDDDQLYDEQ